jgi:transmembrane sensor
MIDEQALDWVIRTRDPDFGDWDGFTRWLEADPAHARAYDALADWDEGLASEVPPVPLEPARVLPVPANDPGEPGWKRWRIGGLAAAAAGLLAVVTYTMMPHADPYSVTTGAGQRQEIALADGTRIALNGDTTLRLDRNNPRFAALDRGEAVFTVRHDAGNPFQVMVGKTVLQDAGTVFNVASGGGVMRVGVAEGEVIFNPQAEAISLPAGKALRLSERDASVSTSSIAQDAVASWRSGRLVFDNAPVNDVAGDIARNLGVAVRTTPGAATQRFTGTVALDRDPARFFAAAAPLMGLEATRDRNGWLLKEGDGASH